MSASSGIQGQLLDVTVVHCKQLRNTEMFTRQDPYVCVEYANSRFRTRTCSDGGRNPTFQEKFQIPLTEGLRELTITVWNRNNLRQDIFIGSGIVQLQNVLSQGYDDSSWSIQTRNLKYAGEVKLVMYFSVASRQNCSCPTAPHGLPELHMDCSCPTAPRRGKTAHVYPPFGGYPYPPAANNPAPYPPYGQHYPPPPAAYPPCQHYPPPPAAHPPYYPPQRAPQPPYYPPPGPYPGVYPPPPY